jgi:hypothetical protein
VKILLTAVLAAALASPAEPPPSLVSHYAAADTAPTADPDAPFWKGVTGLTAANDRWGKAIPGHETELRSRWTSRNLYLLFVCPYSQLNLKPDPTATAETNHLWEWDVTEAFIGSDFTNITKYKEFEISPQGEWVDLDIDRGHPDSQGGWQWNSGFQVRARLAADQKIWYGEMRIPFDQISPVPAREGLELRANFYRIQGPPMEPGRLNTRLVLSWRPTYKANNHVPESFGTLHLAGR